MGRHDRDHQQYPHHSRRPWLTTPSYRARHLAPLFALEHQKTHTLPTDYQLNTVVTLGMSGTSATVQGFQTIRFQCSARKNLETYSVVQREQISALLKQWSLLNKLPTLVCTANRYSTNTGLETQPISIRQHGALE